MEGPLSTQTSVRGPVKVVRNRGLSKLGLARKYGMQHLVSRQTLALLLIGVFVASANGLPHRIPTELFYNHGASKLELLLSPEDTLTVLQLLTTLDQRRKLQNDLEKPRQQKKYDLDDQGRTKDIKRNSGIKKTPYARSNSNGNIDYEDFPEVVPFLEAVSNENLGIYKAPKKRYLGIDIPDYISSGGNPEAIKNMSSKLKALGRRRRR